jgi:hypothetical protein
VLKQTKQKANIISHAPIFFIICDPPFLMIIVSTGTGWFNLQPATVFCFCTLLSFGMKYAF